MRQHRWLSSVDIVPMQHDTLGLVSLALSMAFVCFFFFLELMWFQLFLNWSTCQRL